MRTPTPETAPKPNWLALGLVEQSIANQAAIAVEHTSPEDAQLLAVQSVFRKRYEDEVLAPRRAIWNSTLDILGQECPSDAQYNSAKREATLLWTFQSNAPMWGLHVATKVGATFEPIFPETESAVRYLASDDPPTVFRNHKVPKNLLGITATGRGRQRDFPKDQLLARIAEDELQRTTKIAVTIAAKAIDGTANANTHLKFTADKGNLDLLWNPFYLKPENAESIYADLRKGFVGGEQNRRGEPIPNPTPGDAEAFLTREYLTTSLRPRAEQIVGALSDANDLLAVSTIAPNTPPAFFLESVNIGELLGPK